jgi:hypothetical protein
MGGTLRIAYKLLMNDRAKYAALLVGITFAVSLMIEMTSLFAGILARSSATVINIGASIWVMDPAIQTVASSIPLPDYVTRTLSHCLPRSAAVGGTSAERRWRRILERQAIFSVQTNWLSSGNRNQSYAIVLQQVTRNP